ncbi:MAG: hypothetical protein GY845_26045 [Planctomycetes bacterium]|nr:hypothetical protein [Planctomycetota bacterium]
MPVSIIKDTIEITDMLLDSQGNAFIQRRINLSEGFAHQLLQTDIFFDSWIGFQGQKTPFEVVISPYPQIPTRMAITNQYANALSYTAAGDDTVLFKANGQAQDFGHSPPTYNQFPSKQIAANQLAVFYTDHLYVSINLIGDPDHAFEDVRMSFMLVLNNRKIGALTSAMGQMAENHDAMCAELVSTGRLVGRGLLRGNVFPWWRYGGIRPEKTFQPNAAGSFFLQLPTGDEELMQTTAQVRSVVADARTMTPFYEGGGRRFPEWLRMNLNEGFQSGPIRDQWPPTKHADNGNVLCL